VILDLEVRYTWKGKGILSGWWGVYSCKVVNSRCGGWGKWCNELGLMVYDLRGTKCVFVFLFDIYVIFDFGDVNK
jgi:hypothetical protein